MRFPLEIYDHEIVPMLTRLVAIAGDGPWSKKFSTLQHQFRENPFLGEWMIERHGIELKFAQLLGREAREGRFPVEIQDHVQYELYAFAVGVVRIYDLVSRKGQTRLRGMLLDGLKPNNNLLSLQHEVLTCVHLMNRGYEVELNDIENGSGVDFIARLDGLELEVECKMFTGDLGRKLVRRKVLMLNHHLRATVERTFKSATRGIIARITLPDRLSCTPGQLRAIDAALSSAVLKGNAVTKTVECEIEVKDFYVANSPFHVEGDQHPTHKAVEDFVHAMLGKRNVNLMILYRPRKRAVVVLIESAKPDNVLKGVHRQLREATSAQFTKTRPGILSAQFQELTAEDMLELGKSDSSRTGTPTALQIMTSQFLNSPNREHIHTVAYRSHGTLVRAPGAPIKEEGHVYYFPNRNNPYANDPRARAFAA